MLSRHIFIYKILLLVVLLFLSPYVYARGLSVEEMRRLRLVWRLLDGVETESWQQTIVSLERSPHPGVRLQMKEAIAKTYTDIVKEENVLQAAKKRWLYSMVCLNMAYLQFAGQEGFCERTTALNKWIRLKLKRYLPVNIYRQPGFFYSLK